SIFTSCIFSFGINAIGNDNRTIRVAYPIQKGLTEIDEQGNYFLHNYIFFALAHCITYLPLYQFHHFLTSSLIL
ncbi:hypothetical protein EWM25_19085, partial [Clostridioides difficile]